MVTNGALVWMRLPSERSTKVQIADYIKLEKFAFDHSGMIKIVFAATNGSNDSLAMAADEMWLSLKFR